MQIKSWAVAVAIIAGLTFAVSQVLAMKPAEPAGDPPAAPPAKAAEAASTDSTAPKTSLKTPLIKLSLNVTGLDRGGCDVEIKPGNAACKFRPVSKIHVTSDGKAEIELRNVEIRGSDRLLSVVITIREAGQQSKEVYRAFRLSARQATAASPPLFGCYVSSPSKIARLEEERTVKK
jgi:hypothetical protein